MDAIKQGANTIPFVFKIGNLITMQRAHEKQKSRACVKEMSRFSFTDIHRGFSSDTMPRGTSHVAFHVNIAPKGCAPVLLHTVDFLSPTPCHMLLYLDLKDLFCSFSSLHACLLLIDCGLLRSRE